MRSKKPDYILLTASAILIILGIMILTSVSAFISLDKFGNTFYYLRHQILFGLIPGAVLAFIVFIIPLSRVRKYTPILLLANLVLLALVFLPKIGTTVWGASRWLSLGPYSFQPSELLKLTFILYLASWLTAKTKEKKANSNYLAGFSQTLVAFLIVLGLIALALIFQPDVSTLGIILITAFLMYFLAQTPIWHIILLVLMGVGGLFSLIKLESYRMARLAVFLKPDIDPMGIGYQVKQSLIAIGSGGIFGLGLGMSRQKFGFLPQPMSDTIFAVFLEEIGFIGAVILISLFLVFAWRGFKIAKSAPDKFSQMTALGISLWITIQAFVNMGSMIGVLPLTGIPLPLISYGGSHLIIELIGVGILLNISRQT